jgi:predicted metal-dependent hydrolase
MDMSRTPNNIAYISRKTSSQYQKLLASDWHGGDRFKTIMMNAISFLLPSGEKLLIDVINNNLKNITDEKLLKECKWFIRQEVNHSAEHIHYNKMLCEARGYDYDGLQASSHLTRNSYKVVKRALGEQYALAMTACIEHLNSIAGELMLTDPRLVAGLPSEMRGFWEWHAIEEIEHKAVCFDVYLALYNDRELLNKVMHYSTLQLGDTVMSIACNMFAMEGGSKEDMVAWITESEFVSGENGILQTIETMIEPFYHPTFHPWDHDNSELISKFSK